MSFKQKVHDHFSALVTATINRLQMQLADLKETGANETKSTAGDKHETALAMVQLEQEKVRHQLSEVQQQLAVLQKQRPEMQHTVVAPGSLVKTNRGFLYLSIAAGKAVVDGQTIIALSPQSPLGKQLLQLKAGQTTTINTTTYLIENVS